MSPEGAQIRIVSVTSKREMNWFLEVPHVVFKDDPNWIPPLLMERREFLSPAKNPYFDHAEVQLFVALIDGQPVGRISAQIDRLRLERNGDATGQFGFLDAIDRPDLFQALLKTAETWLSQRGMKQAEGPYSLSINSESGLLVKGFERPPVIMMGHARPYYQHHIEACGYKKAKDLIAYDYDALVPFPKAIDAMVNRVRRSGKLKVRTLSKKNIKRDLALIMDIFNDAWSENWGFVPLTDKEVTALGKNLKLLVSEGYVYIVDWQGEPAAMAVTLPNINHWMRDLNGRLLPFGWLRFLWRMYARPPLSIRLPMMGVRKKYHAGLTGSVLAFACIDAVRTYHVAHGTSRAELSWVLEDNLAMRRIIETISGDPYKTYRIYQRALQDAA